jgi:hypothetical protein
VLNKIGKLNTKMGRINVELSDELEKKLRFKTIEKFGGKKGDLSRALEEAVKKWVTPEQAS